MDTKIFMQNRSDEMNSKETISIGKEMKSVYLPDGIKSLGTPIQKIPNNLAFFNIWTRVLTWSFL